LKRFELARRALWDLQEIWDFISEDSFDAADRIVEDLDQSFSRLAATPGMGHRRDDITKRDVLFWPVHSYLIIYRNSTPLQIVRIIHGKRDVKNLLER
jgi:toxin ParE1/3/4